MFSGAARLRMTKKPKLYKICVPGPMLARGFWLYVWEVTTADRTKWLYVGRTGDSSTPNAQSPVARLSQHLGKNPKSNALWRNLTRSQINPLKCGRFEITAYGPIRPEEQTMARHCGPRDIMAGLEKELYEELKAAGYGVLNQVRSRKPVDKQLFREIRDAFASKFQKL
jgi:hypothetical protein